MYKSSWQHEVVEIARTFFLEAIENAEIDVHPESTAFQEAISEATATLLTDYPSRCGFAERAFELANAWAASESRVTEEDTFA